MLNQEALDTLFTQARTHNAWLNKPVTNGQLREIYELMKWAPTEYNCSPIRIAFLKSDEAKKKLMACMDEENAAKVKAAPIIAIIGTDMAFARKLQALYPHASAQSWLGGDEQKIAQAAIRNASVQGGYFILATRATGLDCGPMLRFDAEKVDATFFVGTAVKANFICGIGYGDEEVSAARLSRLTFDASCAIVL
jgi:3-hydroxypropanoate dehydrogenase